MKATELLRHDHRVVERPFRDHRAAGSDAQRHGELDRCRAGDHARDDLMRRLASAVAQHVQDDENELMPQLCARADEQALRELGREIDQGKQRAPRPHPHAPDTSPALTLAAPVATIYDRLRDRMQGRPRT